MSLVTRLRDNLWLLRACRDWETLRAMKQADAAPTAELRSLRLRNLDPPVLYRPGTTDIPVAWELFHGREYECTGPWDFPTVVDCGANVGLFMAYALMKMGSRLQRYVGVEPDRESFSVLERQAVTLGIRSKSDLYQAAVHERDEELAFDARGPSWARHLSPQGAQRVPGLRIESILDAAGLQECDLLKLDIEGGERTVLPQMPQWGPRVRALVVELHDGLDYAWFAAHARRAGFDPYPPGALFLSHPSALRRTTPARSHRGRSARPLTGS